MPRDAVPAPGSSAIHHAGEAFGPPSATGSGVRRPPPPESERIGMLRAWALRLRLAAEAQQSLGGVVGAACADAGLVGPAGDALRELGGRVSVSIAEAAAACDGAADELDHEAARLLLVRVGDAR